MLRKHFLLSMLKTVVLLLLKIWSHYTFFSGFFGKKKDKKKKSIYLKYKSFLRLYMSILSLLINWMHHCRIEVLIYFEKKCNLTDPNLWTAVKDKDKDKNWYQSIRVCSRWIQSNTVSTLWWSSCAWRGSAGPDGVCRFFLGGRGAGAGAWGCGRGRG